MVLLPGILTLFKEVVVEPAALLKHVTQLSGLLASGIEAVEECLTHTHNLAHKFVLCNREADFQPTYLVGAGLSP